MSRLRPSFFIIGERKCGTSSLFRYLCEHPQVIPGRLKESNFFSHSQSYIRNHIQDYYNLFPSLSDKEASNKWPELDQDGKVYHTTLKFPIEKGIDYITGEASANVLSTVNPKKFKKFLPDIKLILLFRNPVDRAFSHHAMHRRYKKEGRKGFQWVINSKTSFRWEKNLLSLGIDGPYLAPGRYSHYLMRWLKYYPLDQMRVIRMEDLEDAKKAQEIMSSLCDFLDIDQFDFSEVLTKRFNNSQSKPTDSSVTQWLKEYYAPFNHELESLLKRKFNWDGV